jgi:hypothetical protein
MHYELDPKLLPPAGASVQCTRCSFVFTALPSGEVVIPSDAETLPGAGQSARGEVSRSSSSSTTRIFGNPYLQQQAAEQAAATPKATKAVGSGAYPAPRAPAAKPGAEAAQEGGKEDANATLVYGSRGNRPDEEAPARTPARGSAAVGPAPAPVGKTQVFGAVAARPPPPAPSTTQVFGAVSLPPQAPAPATTQVFGAVQIPAPSPATTQAFGADVLPATKPPSPVTTQVFGADSIPGVKPKPAVATTQVFGAESIPGAKPRSAATTTQVFGAGAVQAAEKASGRTGSAERPQAGSAPWLAEPGAGPSASRGATGEQRSAGASSGPVSLPPEEPVPVRPPTPVPLPARAPMQVSAPAAPPVTLPPEPLPERSGAMGSSRRLSSFEQAPDVFDRIEREGTPSEPESSGGKERLLVVVAAVVVLGLTIWLTYPLWRTRDAGMPPDALRAKDEAVALLRRDDEASREQAFARLRPLVARFPKYTEAQAELAVALALKLDDTKVELELLAQQAARLRKEIEQLTAAQAPADWENRVNAAKAELENLGIQRRPHEAAVAELTKQVEAAQQLIRAAPETEPAADVVARLKAQAILAGVLGSDQAPPLAERLRKVENPAHWSVISLAEYVLNAGSSPIPVEDQGESLQAVRERDTTFIRPYVLGARMALRRKDLATAQALLDTVEALNPNHALARKLRTWAAPAGSAP